MAIYCKTIFCAAAFSHGAGARGHQVRWITRNAPVHVLANEITYAANRNTHRPIWSLTDILSGTCRVAIHGNMSSTLLTSAANKLKTVPPSSASAILNELIARRAARAQMPAARLVVVVGDEPAVRAALVRGLAAWLAAYDPGAWAVRDGHAARAADLVVRLARPGVSPRPLPGPLVTLDATRAPATLVGDAVPHLVALRRAAPATPAI